MLDKLRDSSRSFGSYLIFGVIILVFVIYFGPGGQSCGDIGSGSQLSWAAKVDGEEIPLRDFRLEYDNLYRQYQAQMGDRFDPQLAQQMGIRTSAIDRLVTRKLLIREAKRMGIATTDEEVAQAIREQPAFQKNGHFDFETYRAALRNWQGITPARFEAQVREDLLVGKVINQLRLSAKVTDDEVESTYLRENDRASIAFVRVIPREMEKQVEVTAEAVAALLASEDGKKRVADEYEAQAWKFKTPKRVRAQHILIKVEEDAPEAEVKAAEEKILAAKKEIDGGADFGEVARRVSEDVATKENGGDLGLFGPGSMVKPFEDAAMALEVGQISEPVRSRFGFHLIKVNEIQPPTEKKLEEVQEELAREILAKDGSRDAARARAEAILREAKGRSLLEVHPIPEAPAKEPSPVVSGKTDAFPVSSDFVPRLGVASELVRAVAGVDAPGLLGRIFEVGDAFVVAEVLTREKPDLAKLGEKERGEIRERLLQRKRNEAIQAFVDQLKEDAKVETNDALVSAGF